jgi:[protein-PII] uridylyltransferase
MSAPRVPSLAALAREMLVPAAGKSRSKQEMERAIRRFRKIGEERFRMLHRAGGSGVEVCEKRAGMVDLALMHLWEYLTGREEYALSGKTKLSLVATGGYGREQMNPCSDVDMLFLLSGKGAHVPAVVGALVTQFLTMLWDVGFKVGDSSTRSVGDTSPAGGGR